MEVILESHSLFALPWAKLSSRFEIQKHFRGQVVTSKLLLYLVCYLVWDAHLGCFMGPVPPAECSGHLLCSCRACFILPC